MPIEFDCPQCQNRLRVPDGSEGQKALCPKCSEQIIIPQQDEANSNPFVNPPADSSGTNPYASPTSTTEIPTEGAQASLTNSTFSVTHVLTETWNGFTENLGAFLLLGLLLVGMYVATSVVTVPISIAGQATGEPTFIVIAEILAGIIGQFLGAFIAAVGFRYTLDVLSGSRSPFERAFKVLPFVLRIFFTNIVVGLLAFASVLVIALPILPFFFFLQGAEGMLAAVAIILGLTVFALYIFIFTRLCLPLLFIIDRGQGVFDSISSSFTYTKGNALTIFFSMLIIGLAGTALTVVTCGLGLIAVIPLMTTALSIIYRLATGQPARIPQWAQAANQ